MKQPLDGLRVLELATEVAGPYTGKMLADFGAEVIKVEPPGGDPSRLHGPFPDDQPDPEQSALFLHLNANKQSIVASIDDGPGRAVIGALAAESDIILESFAPGRMAESGLGYEDLRRQNPAVVVTSFTPFGQSGPYAHYEGADIVTYAMGGPMFSTGIAEREPVKLGGNVISCQAGNVAATATLGAYVAATQSGQGCHIDLSMFEAQAGSVDRRVTYLLHWLWGGGVTGRQQANRARTLPADMFPTADGYVLALTIPAWAQRMLTVLDDPDLTERFATTDWMRDEGTADAVLGAFYPWLFQGDKADRARVAQQHKWAVTALNTPLDLLDDEHFVGREFFPMVDHPVAGSHRRTGPPFRLGNAWQFRRPAPTLDQHGPELRAGLAPPAPTDPSSPSQLADNNEDMREPRLPPARTAAGPKLPLEGIRVLDLTVVWAGPACTMHLSDLGAEVIRVDNPYVFPPATRGVSPRPANDLLADLGALGGSYPFMSTDHMPWNTQGMFAAHARSKKSCTLDIRTEQGRELFLSMVEQADVVVENNSVATLDKLGIGWDVVHARNPRLVMCRMAPMGLEGPYSSYVGFGASFEALCGLTAVRGYGDTDPTSLSTVFHMDPASGAGAAFAVMCALLRRDQSGQGELIDFAQSENMMNHIGEYFIDADRTGRTHGPGGNRHPFRAPQGCYRCVGDDRWVVISVGSDEQWSQLAALIGEPQLANDPRFATVAARHSNHDELDALLAAWTENIEANEVFHRCQAKGVAAGVVYDEADTYADPHLAARGFFRQQGSEDIGTWLFPGHQWRWTGPPMKWGSINRLGDSNEYVYRQLLGLNDDEYQALVENGHITDGYLQPDGTQY